MEHRKKSRNADDTASLYALHRKPASCNHEERFSHENQVLTIMRSLASHNHEKQLLTTEVHMPIKCPAQFGFTMEGNLYAIPCGQWQCPTCAKTNARLWAWRCRLQLEHDKRQYWFITLTLPSKYRVVSDGYKALPSLFDTMRKDFQRRNDEWKYCAFVEGQPRRNGMPHFHIISSAKTPYRVKDYAVHHGFGHQAAQTAINGGQAAHYCAKYASKVSPSTPKGFRRVRASRDWHKLPDFEGDPILIQANKETLSDYLLRVHFTTSVDIDDLLYIWQNKLYTNDVTNIDTSLPHKVA